MRRPFFLILWLILPLSYAKPLMIGTTINNPPFNEMVNQNNEFNGFDIDVINEICTRIQSECQFKPLLFDNLFIALQNGQIDLANAAIIITKARERQFLFSHPYLQSTALYITKNQSPITSLADIKNKRVGIRNDTPFQGLAQKMYGNQITIVLLPEVSDLLSALNSGSVDVILLDEAAARYWVANNGAQYQFIGNAIPVGKGYGIMANQNQQALIAKINQALTSMENDGTYLQIYNRYFNY